MMEDRVLTIDDDENIGAFITDVAIDIGYDAKYVSDFGLFKATYASFQPTVIFVDLQMPKVDGIEVLNELHRIGSDANIILMSGFDERVLKSAREFGLSKSLCVKDVLTKPIDIEALEDRLRSMTRTTAVAVTQGEISTGLARNEFFVRYQPKIALAPERNDEVIGAEALIRWKHPELGELSPNRFVPIAEEVGLIGDMTDYVLKMVVDQLGEWSGMGLETNVAVNLSALLLDDLSLPDRYAEVLSAAGISPSSITLELTETAVMHNVVDATEILTRFRLKGFGLSIDDFGTGFSSLVQLYRMPFSELKIDQSFVSRAPQDKEAAKIVKVVTYLAHELGLSVCAEGVETKETLEYLRTLGCEKIQGYFIDKPLLADEFINRGNFKKFGTCKKTDVLPENRTA